MKKEFFRLFVIGSFVIMAVSPCAGAKEAPGLLPSKTLELVLAHTSGDLAYQHIRRISRTFGAYFIRAVPAISAAR